jgi:hypothetical protein
MRWYSAGEHLFCMTSSVRRAIAMIRSVIIIGSGTGFAALASGHG